MPDVHVTIVRPVVTEKTSAAYGAPIIPFAGSYKQLEEAWSEWLWKLADLLSRIDAVSARVSLDCVLGSFTWGLAPVEAGRWVIVDAPDDDFSIDPEWLDHVRRTLPEHVWDQHVERRLGR